MARFTLFESLEPRMFLSAGPLAQAKAALSDAVNKLATDKSTGAMVISADKARVAADKKAHPDLAPLQSTLKQDELARKNTLAGDRSNLKIAVANDNSIILSLRNDIHTDKIQNNPAQSAIDKAQLAMDLITLQKDRDTLNTVLQDDIISTAATINKDHQAIANSLRMHGNAALAGDKQTLADDEQTWADTVAGDRKAVSSARLALASLK